MILHLDESEISKHAAKVLAEQRGESLPEPFYYLDDAEAERLAQEGDNEIEKALKINPAIKTTQDETLTLIDLSADGSKQNLVAPDLLANKLKIMSPTIKNIELIISDVDVNTPLELYVINLYYALYNRGKDVTIVASSLPVFESRNRGEGYTATCIIPPSLPEAKDEAFPKDWRIYKVRGDTVLKGKIKYPYEDFNYQTFLKLPEKQLLWHGEDLLTWLYQNDRIMDYQNYLRGKDPEEVERKKEESRKHRLELIEKYSSKDSEHSVKKARINDSKQASTSSSEASNVSNSPSLPSLLPLLSSAPFASGESNSSSPNIKAIQAKVTLFNSSPLLAGQYSDSLKEKKTSSSEADSQHKDNETRPVIK